MSSNGRVITILSGKGGTGKTNICVNLAVALRRLGKNVLIIDGDLGLANVEVLLGINPKYTLYDVIYRNLSLESVVTYGPEGILVIPGGSGALELSQIEPYRQELLMDEMVRLGKSVDYIFIDAGAGIHQDVLTFASGSDEVLLVMTPEPTALADAYTIIKALNLMDEKKEIRAIVNKTHNSSDGEESITRLNILTSRFLRLSISYLGSIPEDVWVERAIREQNLFVVRYPFSKAARALNDIAVKIAGEEKKGAGFKRFFKSIVDKISVR